jgi:cytidylate kinase
MDVAAGLAATLGLKVIQSDTVAKCIAERLGVDEGAVLRYVNGSASVLKRWRIDRRKLFHYAAEETLRLAQRGNVLIKGWGVATLLCDLPGVISVRVCAPMDFWVRVLMDRLGTNVREQIERYDAARTRTMRAYFNVEEEDPRLYHIVLNTQRLSIEACVKTISETRRKRPIPGQRSHSVYSRQQAGGGGDQFGTGRAHQLGRGAAWRLRIGR